MNYDNPELMDRLAAEYVLGTLRGAARRRFERLLLESESAREATWRWEGRLGDLVDALPPQDPPRSVWRAIEARVGALEPARRGLGFWRAWAAVASLGLLASLGLVAWQANQPPSTPMEQQVAFVEGDAATQPLWVVSVNMTTGELKTRAITATARAMDEVYELWMLPSAGDPRSLGLLPVNGGQTARDFSPALLDLLRTAKGLAVSLEPPGGSPTGVPTGPVVYQAQLVAL